MSPVGTESVQDAPFKRIKSVQNALPRGTESMQSVFFYNAESQQTLYLKEILTRELKKEWEGFNN